MRYTGLVGCTLQGIGPIALLFILRMRQHPQLGIVAFVGAMSYVMNLLCSSMWWWIFEANFMWHIATNVVTHLFMRCFLFFGYMKAEGIFLKNGEVICASNYGVSHVALALGVGYGLMEVFLTFGTLLFSDYNIGPPFATLYDPSRCTSMTTIYWQSFTSSIFSLLHPMWMMAFFIAMESLLFRQTSHEEDTSEDKLPSRQLRRWITTVVPQNRFPKRRLSRRCAIGLLLLIITLQSASIFLTTCTCQISIIPLALILIATYGTILVCASRVYVPFRPIRSGPECVPTAQSVPSPGVSETEALITQIQSTA